MIPQTRGTDPGFDMLGFVLFVDFICLLIVIVGALGIASPDRLIALVRRVQTPSGLYLVAAVRVAMGLALFFAAPASRAPEFVGPLGLIVILIGLVTPLFGLSRFRRLLDAWERMGHVALRIWAALALGFGLFLAYLVTV